jgi:predicted  nucleic acid-binding Zn-ribbon protein
LEDTLRHLYALQQIDSSLDELEEMKGDLPQEVRALEDRLAALQEQVGLLDRTMKEMFAARDTADTDIIAFKERVEKFKAQQYAVRNNREYDALTREMDAAVETIARLEKDMESFESKATIARADLETSRAQVVELSALLTEKRAALGEISKTTEEEELQYRHKREKAVRHISGQQMAAYERIRKAKKGKAVVRIVRGSCGGCFNKVPPQKLLELRQNAKMFMCERCGRILVSDDVAEKASSHA